MLISWDLTIIFYEVTYTCFIQIPGASEIQNTGHTNTLQKDDCYIQSLLISVNIHIDMF